MMRLNRFWAALDRHPRMTDAVIAAVFAVFALLTLRVSWQFMQPVRPLFAVGLVLLLMLPLAWRREFPLAVLVVMTVVRLVSQYYDVSDYLWSPNAWWLAFYGAGAY